MEVRRVGERTDQEGVRGRERGRAVETVERNAGELREIGGQVVCS